MEIQLQKSIIDVLSWRGVLAYTAVLMLEGTESTTAVLAGTVRCQTGVMLQGLKELAVVAPGAVAYTGSKTKRWRCGFVTVEGGGELQQKDSERFRLFVDDLKKYWDCVNKQKDGSIFPPFAMNGNDGRVIQQFLAKHRHWFQSDWRIALNNRKVSAKIKAVPRSEPLYKWVGSLESYYADPLNKYGLPLEGTGDKTTDVRERNRQNLEDAIIKAKP